MEETLTGQGLKKIRRELEFNQKQMAGLLDVSLSAYKMYETDKRKFPLGCVDKLMGLLSRTYSHSLEGSIDWLKVRFKTLDYKRVIKEVLRLDIKDFMDSDKTYMGYEDMVTYGNIRVHFSYDIKKINEGTLIEFSGTACREYESLLVQNKTDWRSFFSSCFDFALSHEELMPVDDFMSVTRLDIALDELYQADGSNVDLHDVLARMRADVIRVHSFGGCGQMEDFKRVKGVFVSTGLTLKFGNRQSEVYIRFYEKDLEQAYKKQVHVDYIREVEGCKNRYEIELHGTKAFGVMQDLAQEV